MKTVRVQERCFWARMLFGRFYSCLELDPVMSAVAPPKAVLLAAGMLVVRGCADVPLSSPLPPSSSPLCHGIDGLEMKVRVTARRQQIGKKGTLRQRRWARKG